MEMQQRMYVICVGIKLRWQCKFKLVYTKCDYGECYEAKQHNRSTEY